ncbi:iron ABC transporter ATP-binding protein [Leifsonia sp. F6_8S_P_1B]|uniref:Iron ABC transporter ATP-binding protein n=1 Tax=Leifsonia williamsii TaxID=3035919 RepID=A0ABT8KB45_9MICO|nr:iron ABC transporter ATP-binding protein [Leifsonia williamsii]MDN4614679.1 iron ABC transporter ATP-binding protein [Leifsonia williamsii]
MSLSSRSAARVAVAVVAISGSLLLAGCASKAAPGSTAPATSSPAAGEETPTPTPTPTDPPTPVTLTCDQILTPEQLYAYNPNVGVDAGYAPEKDSLEQKVKDWQGQTCAWSNQSSGDVIQIAVAQPPASAMDGLKNAAITAAQPVPTYGAPPLEGYFKPGSSGQVQIFRGAWWIVAESTAFFEPGDAAQLMESVLGNLPQG